MRTQLLAGLLNLGRHTVTGALTTAGALNQNSDKPGAHLASAVFYDHN